ncbi:unnamed protein product [Amoebophrya sp. A120]|nr:unnamed protein product [Amoebophrya sp. A120]|eukprot:GSA120T00002242001.1
MSSNSSSSAAGRQRSSSYIRGRNANARATAQPHAATGGKNAGQHRRNQQQQPQQQQTYWSGTYEAHCATYDSNAWGANGSTASQSAAAVHTRNVTWVAASQAVATASASSNSSHRVQLHQHSSWTPGSPAEEQSCLTTGHYSSTTSAAVEHEQDSSPVPTSQWVKPEHLLKSHPGVRWNPCDLLFQLQPKRERATSNSGKNTGRDPGDDHEKELDHGAAPSGDDRAQNDGRGPDDAPRSPGQVKLTSNENDRAHKMDVDTSIGPAADGTPATRAVEKNANNSSIADPKIAGSPGVASGDKNIIRGGNEVSPKSIDNQIEVRVDSAPSPRSRSEAGGISTGDVVWEMRPHFRGVRFPERDFVLDLSEEPGENSMVGRHSHTYRSTDPGRLVLKYAAKCNGVEDALQRLHRTGFPFDLPPTIPPKDVFSSRDGALVQEMNSNASSSSSSSSSRSVSKREDLPVRADQDQAPSSASEHCSSDEVERDADVRNAGAEKTKKKKLASTSPRPSSSKRSAQMTSAPVTTTGNNIKQGEAGAGAPPPPLFVPSGRTSGVLPTSATASTSVVGAAASTLGSTVSVPVPLAVKMSKLEADSQLLKTNKTTTGQQKQAQQSSPDSSSSQQLQSFNGAGGRPAQEVVAAAAASSSARPSDQVVKQEGAAQQMTTTSQASAPATTSMRRPRIAELKQKLLRHKEQRRQDTTIAVLTTADQQQQQLLHQVEIASAGSSTPAAARSAAGAVGFTLLPSVAPVAASTATATSSLLEQVEAASVGGSAVNKNSLPNKPNFEIASTTRTPSGASSRATTPAFFIANSTASVPVLPTKREHPGASEVSGAVKMLNTPEGGTAKTRTPKQNMQPHPRSTLLVPQNTNVVPKVAAAAKPLADAAPGLATVVAAAPSSSDHLTEGGTIVPALSPALVDFGAAGAGSVVTAPVQETTAVVEIEADDDDILSSSAPSEQDEQNEEREEPNENPVVAAQKNQEQLSSPLKKRSSKRTVLAENETRRDERSHDRATKESRNYDRAGRTSTAEEAAAAASDNQKKKKKKDKREATSVSLASGLPDEIVETGETQKGTGAGKGQLQNGVDKEVDHLQQGSKAKKKRKKEIEDDDVELEMLPAKKKKNKRKREDRSAERREKVPKDAPHADSMASQANDEHHVGGTRSQGFLPAKIKHSKDYDTEASGRHREDPAALGDTSTAGELHQAAGKKKKKRKSDKNTGAPKDPPVQEILEQIRPKLSAASDGDHDEAEDDNLQEAAEEVLLPSSSRTQQKIKETLDKLKPAAGLQARPEVIKEHSHNSSSSSRSGWTTSSSQENDDSTRRKKPREPSNKQPKLSAKALRRLERQSEREKEKRAVQKQKDELKKALLLAQKRKGKKVEDKDLRATAKDKDKRVPASAKEAAATAKRGPTRLVRPREEKTKDGRKDGVAVLKKRKRKESSPVEEPDTVSRSSQRLSFSEPPKDKERRLRKERQNAIRPSRNKEPTGKSKDTAAVAVSAGLRGRRRMDKNYVLPSSRSSHREAAATARSSSSASRSSAAPVQKRIKRSPGRRGPKDGRDYNDMVQKKTKNRVEEPGRHGSRSRSRARRRNEIDDSRRHAAVRRDGGEQLYKDGAARSHRRKKREDHYQDDEGSGHASAGAEDGSKDPNYHGKKRSYRRPHSQSRRRGRGRLRDAGVASKSQSAGDRSSKERGGRTTRRRDDGREADKKKPDLGPRGYGKVIQTEDGENRPPPLIPLELKDPDDKKSSKRNRDHEDSEGKKKKNAASRAGSSKAKDKKNSKNDEGPERTSENKETKARPAASSSAFETAKAGLDQQDQVKLTQTSTNNDVAELQNHDPSQDKNRAPSSDARTPASAAGALDVKGFKLKGRTVKTLDEVQKAALRVQQEAEDRAAKSAQNGTQQPSHTSKSFDEVNREAALRIQQHAELDRKNDHHAPDDTTVTTRDDRQHATRGASGEALAPGAAGASRKKTTAEVNKAAKLTNQQLLLKRAAAIIDPHRQKNISSGSTGDQHRSRSPDEQPSNNFDTSKISFKFLTKEDVSVRTRIPQPFATVGGAQKKTPAQMSLEEIMQSEQPAAGAPVAASEELQPSEKMATVLLNRNAVLGIEAPDEGEAGASSAHEEQGRRHPSDGNERRGPSAQRTPRTAVFVSKEKVYEPAAGARKAESSSAGQHRRLTASGPKTIVEIAPQQVAPKRTADEQELKRKTVLIGSSAQPRTGFETSVTSALLSSAPNRHPIEPAAAVPDLKTLASRDPTAAFSKASVTISARIEQGLAPPGAAASVLRAGIQPGTKSSAEQQPQLPGAAPKAASATVKAAPEIGPVRLKSTVRPIGEQEQPVEKKKTFWARLVEQAAGKGTAPAQPETKLTRAQELMARSQPFIIPKAGGAAVSSKSRASKKQQAQSPGQLPMDWSSESDAERNTASGKIRIRDKHAKQQKDAFFQEAAIPAAVKMARGGKKTKEEIRANLLKLRSDQMQHKVNEEEVVPVQEEKAGDKSGREKKASPASEVESKGKNSAPHAASSSTAVHRNQTRQQQPKKQFRLSDVQPNRRTSGGAIAEDEQHEAFARHALLQLSDDPFDMVGPEEEVEHRPQTEEEDLVLVPPPHYAPELLVSANYIEQENVAERIPGSSGNEDLKVSIDRSVSSSSKLQNPRTNARSRESRPAGTTGRTGAAATAGIQDHSGVIVLEDEDGKEPALRGSSKILEKEKAQAARNAPKQAAPQIELIASSRGPRAAATSGRTAPAPTSQVIATSRHPPPPPSGPSSTSAAARNAPPPPPPRAKEPPQPPTVEQQQKGAAASNPPASTASTGTTTGTKKYDTLLPGHLDLVSRNRDKRAVTNKGVGLLLLSNKEAELRGAARSTTTQHQQSNGSHPLPHMLLGGGRSSSSSVPGGEPAETTPSALQTARTPGGTVRPLVGGATRVPKASFKAPQPKKSDASTRTSSYLDRLKERLG